MARHHLRSALGTDMPSVAKMLQASGRGKDRLLAHITPAEAALLKARGGRGSRNPRTGLLEFDDDPLAPVEVTPQVSAAPAIAPETVVSSAPAPTAPAISAPPPTISAPGGASSNNAPETVTSTANAPPAPVQVTPSVLDPTLSPVQVTPQATIPAPTPAVAPTASAAPESVTVQGTQTAPALSPVTVTPQAEIPQESFSQKTKDWLGNNSTLLSALGLGGLGVFGALNNAKAGKQAAGLESNIAALGQPLANIGNQELSQTLSGGLNPQSLQALQAVQAQLGQGQAMGAVSAQQAAQAISGTFATLLQGQLTQALNILQAADSYLQEAYLQGYQANVANQTNTTNFFTSLAQMAASISGLATPTTIRVGA
jgi:hypothetical protein